MAELFQASSDFSASQGYLHWYYLRGDGAQLSWFTDRWSDGAGGYPAIKGDIIHPGPSHDAVRRWVVPSAGTVDVSGNAMDRTNDGGDGVVVSIRHNGNTLWQYSIPPGDLVGSTYSLSFAVSAGDVIDFRVNRVGTHSFDWTIFDPLIAFTPGSPPPPPPPGITLGPREVIQTPAQRQSAGLEFWPDGLLDARNLGGGNYIFFAPQGGNARTVRTSGSLTTPFASPQFQPFATLQAFDYVAGNQVYRDPTTGMHLLFYHAENYLAGPSVFTASIGLARSTDCGQSWQDIGVIIQPNDRTQHCDTNGGTYVVKDGWLYVWHKDRTVAATQYFCVSRASLDDVLAAARSGTVTPFYKWDGTSFAQPGLNGVAAVIEPGNLAGGWFDVKWCDHLGEFFCVGTDLTTNPDNNLYWTTSPDGIVWQPRAVLENDPGYSSYPSLIGTGTDAKVLDQSFWVYWMYNPVQAFDWNGLELSRRLVTLP